MTSATFWDRFAAEHWEKRPGVFRGLFEGGEPLLTSAQAFAGIMKAATLSRAGAPAFVRFFLEDTLVQSRLSKFLPVADDATFARFADRIQPLCRGGGFGLTVSGFAHHDFALFTRVRRFLRGLYERVGMPGDATDLDVFIGNYRHTPFGIHLDASSNFCVVFEGRKKFLVWPGPVVEGRPDLRHSIDFEDVRDQAIVLEAGPGDVIYWPSSYWHIAESGGELSCVMNIALYIGDHTERFVAGASTAPRPENPAPTSTLPWDPSVSQGVEPFGHGIDAVRAPLPSEDDLRHDVLRAWLARTTAYNIHRTMPDTLPMASLPPSGSLRADPEFPIVAVENTGELLLGCHGHVIEVPAVPKVRAMIDHLNDGAPHAIADLVAGAIGRGDAGGSTFDVGAAEIHAVLENLLAMRAVHVAG